jgi:simple sugar transport system permease protein
LVLPGLPASVAVPVCVLAAAVGGAVWALIPALLKAVRGVHEVISTIMLNFVASALTNYLVVRVLGVPESLRTPELPASTWLPPLSEWFSPLRGSAANSSFLIAVGLVALAQIGLRYTSAGFRLRVVGRNPSAARTYGMSTKRSWALAMGLGGAAAGLVGANFVLGYKHYFEDGFSGGTGFVGIAVALLGAGHPWAVLPAALFMGTLREGGLAVNHLVPKEIVLVIQAVAVLAVLVASRRAATLRWRA